MGPDVQDVPAVVYQSDQDAYACGGQKCSAQSVLFVHENWAKYRVGGNKNLIERTERVEVSMTYSRKEFPNENSTMDPSHLQ